MAEINLELVHFSYIIIVSSILFFIFFWAGGPKVSERFLRGKNSFLKTLSDSMGPQDDLCLLQLCNYYTSAYQDI